MIKLLFFIILTYTIVSFDLCDLNNFFISRAAHFLLGRRENINIIRHYDFFISFFSDFICIVLLLILSSISLGYILCRSVSFASYDTNLSLSCQNHPLSTKPMVDTLNALLTFTTLSHFFLKNLYGLIIIVTDFDMEVIPYIFGFLDLVSDLNVKIHHFLLFCLILNFRLLIYTIHSLLHFSLNRPHDSYALWFIFLRIQLSKDVHSNPGPSSEFSSSFFTFCNWNLNSLSTDDFHRITLLEAHNTNFNYDIISLCETSLNDSMTVKENSLPGYLFKPLNSPDGGKNGGVGLFYKESLPLKIRYDLSFNECLVTEMVFGRKHIFFTVLYRNPAHKASSAEFNSFIDNFEALTNKIRTAKPYAMFFTGDFNAHSQTWYPEGDTNAEGYLIDELFSSLNLNQIISEPTHFFCDDCTPSCIDLVVTDQPNLVLESGVRPSLDPLVRHQITFAKINHKIPPPPKYTRKIWHFKSANINLIRRTMANYQWVEKLGNRENPSDQVNHLTECILNIMSNFVPNTNKTFSSRDPEWFNKDVKKLLRKQNKLYKKYKKNGYKDMDKIPLDNVKTESFQAIKNARELFLRNQGLKLADPNTGQKTYWKILNKFLNKNHIPRIPPLLNNDKFVFDCNEKAKLFNDYFVSQCRPFENNSNLPTFEYLTGSRITSFEVLINENNDILLGLDVNKSNGPDNLSVQMIELCGNHLATPLKLIFDNILATGIFPSQWRKANVTPSHKKNDKQIVTNYRPISLLPILSKVYEKIIFKKLYNYLTSNNLISNNQSGFRPGDSCTNQLLPLVHEIQHAFNDISCLELRSVYLDMSKAFDKV